MDSLDTLHNLEKKVLLTLKSLGAGKFSIDIISEKSGLKKDEVNKAVEWLREKGFVSVEVLSDSKFVISPKFLDYLEKGLPEKRIINALRKGPILFKDLSQTLNLSKDEVNVAIGMLKRSDYISISEGKISLTDLGEAFIKEKKWDEEKLLSLLKSPKLNEEVPENLHIFITPLIERGIIKEEIYSIRNVSLNSEILPKLKDLKIEDEIDFLTSDIIRNETWKSKPFKKYNLNVPPPPLFIGKKQAYLKFIDETKEKMISLGFEEMEGPIVDLSFFNNDALFMPQDHPARDIHDVFFVKANKGKIPKELEKNLEYVRKTHENGWELGSKGWGYKFSQDMTESVMLRSQVTAVSARKMLSKNLKIPGKYFAIGRVFRPDVIDWKHLIEFNQLEGIILGEDLAFKDLLGILKVFAEELCGAKKYKFIPGYYPFTEPTAVLCVYLEGKGWMEIGGSGIFRPEVTKPLGINVPVLAWGMGFDRIFMIKNNINDIRDLFSNNLKFLREIPLKV